MRVYEVAKEYGISSKEILATLSQAGIELSSHMAVLPDEALAILNKKYSKKSQSAANVEKKVAVEPKIDEPKKEIPGRPAHIQSKPLEPKIDNTKKVEKKVMHEQHQPKVSSVSVEEAPVYINPVEPQQEERGPQVKYYAKPIVPEALIVEDQEAVKVVKGHEKVGKFLAQFGVKRPRRRSSAAKRRKLRAKVAAAANASARRDVTEIKIEKSLPLFELADMINKPAGELIIALLRKGLVCNRNHILSPDVIRSLAEQFGLKVDYQVQAESSTGVESRAKTDKAAGQTRWPIVVVMGHVDHGKTTLLDYIRKMNVAGSEKGGITQHISAYEVNGTHGKVVFLDTPGHEAFSHMRQRGATITDLAILVVAADDGVKPQTIEAINHAKEAGVPIIVAVNKIDKVQSTAAIETIKRQLAQHELMSEDWGGQTIIVPISAKTGQGINELLEMVTLQAQLMDLRAVANKKAKAFVVESRMERGLGAVATVICTEGTLKQGDYFTCGNATGKVRLMINSAGKRISQAEPSIPVQISGFDDFSSLGDWLEVVDSEVYFKAKSSRALEIAPSQELTAKVSLDSNVSEKNKKFINVIVKTDTRGSKEAVMDSIDKLLKLNKAIKCPIYVISSGVGDITENDVELAANTNSILLGLHIKAEKNSLNLSKDRDVNVKLFQIIYQMIDYLQEEITKRKEIEVIWKKTGEATVKKVFDIKGSGIIAGCYMRDGVLSKGNKVVCMRSGKAVGEGVVTSLQRDRKSVREVHAGYECGFTCEGFNEWQEGDTVISSMQVKVEEK